QEAYYLTYNENNDILHIDMYNYERKRQIRYRYDANRNVTLYEQTHYNSDNLFQKMTCEYDADSRPLILSYYLWNATLQLTALDWYEIYYYSEGTDTGNGAVDISPSSAWSHSGMIHIRSGRPKQVAVYALSGAKLYESSVPAGTTTIDATRFPKGVYIVAFGDNERQKIALH
ncbi:MAG: T9SS type A sorting domain-containing protein, partial [Tannerella sp.]|nr:T9SS type A sorting domain-containing protein [Tannerella sp.]